MNKQVKDYLKNTNYAQGAIYKVSPHFLLEDFYNWLKANEKIQIIVENNTVYCKDKRVKIKEINE